MPNYCTNKVEISGKPETVKELLAFIKSPASDIDFSKVIPYPEEYASMDAEKSDSGYNAGGYGWCIENWGTKWNAIEPDVDDFAGNAQLDFDTAWSPCQPVIAKLAELYPTLSFKHSYEESGMNFSGFDTYENGTLKIHQEGDYDAYPVYEHDHEEDEDE
jgi:hypothetical protein